MQIAPFSEIFDRVKVSPAVERESTSISELAPTQTLTPGT